MGGALLSTVTLATAQNDVATELKKELDAIRSDYEKRINLLESRIQELESKPEPKSQKHATPKATTQPRKKSSTSAPSHKKTPREEDQKTEPTTETEKIPTENIARAQQKAANDQFKGKTEIRDIASDLSEENLLADRIESILEGYLDITGYFRAGYGRSDQGGPQQAFGIPDLAKYRLGNEAENYGELAFAKTFFPLGMFGGENSENDGPIARMTYRMSFYNPYDDYGSAQDTQFASPEVWGSIANVVPGMPDAKFWAGDRFYRRHDIHINDFYFWDMSGGGGGIEDVTLGNGKLAFAVIGNGAQSGIVNGYDAPDPLNEAGFSKTNFDLRYYDWNFLGGKGEAGLVFASASSGVDTLGNQTPDSEGIALNILKTDKGFWDKNSLNVASLQIGTGPASSFTSGFETFSTPTGSFIRPAPNDAWRFRGTEQLVIHPIEQFAFGMAMVYQYTDYGLDIPDQHWLSGGMRPIWEINDAFSVAFEGGVDWASSTQGGEGGTLGKLTLAPQVSIGNEFFSRPVLRAFVTYAMWSEGLQGQIGGLDYANETSGWTWGFQMETWW